MKEKYFDKFKFEDLFYDSGYRKKVKEKCIKNFHTIEGSAYWGYGQAASASAEDNESFIANPDMLSDETKFNWVASSDLSTENEEKVQAYQRLMSKGFLDTLPKRERQIWDLAFVKWTRAAEIAKTLKLSRSAVETNIRRVAQKLKKAIQVERGIK